MSRPIKGEERPTIPARIAKDMSELLAWISSITNTPISKVIDMELRPVITAKYAAMYEKIKQHKAIIDAARIAAGQPPTDALPPVVQSAPLVGPKKRKSA
jgi:hypothetical protein